MRIVVVIEGGLVSGVFADGEAEVVVVDRDVEGADDDEVVQVEDREAVVHEPLVADDAEFVDAAFDATYG